VKAATMSATRETRLTHRRIVTRAVAEASSGLSDAPTTEVPSTRITAVANPPSAAPINRSRRGTRRPANHRNRKTNTAKSTAAPRRNVPARRRKAVKGPSIPSQSKTRVPRLLAARDATEVTSVATASTRKPRRSRSFFSTKFSGRDTTPNMRRIEAFSAVIVAMADQRSTRNAMIEVRLSAVSWTRSSGRSIPLPEPSSRMPGRDLFTVSMSCPRSCSSSPRTAMKMVHPIARAAKRENRAA